jgi:hypothetical protein
LETQIVVDRVYAKCIASLKVISGADAGMYWRF